MTQPILKNNSSRKQVEANLKPEPNHHLYLQLPMEIRKNCTAAPLWAHQLGASPYLQGSNSLGEHPFQLVDVIQDTLIQRCIIHLR